MRALKIMMILCIYLATGCSVNILSEFGDKTTDAALLFDARMKIDDSDWDGAIESFDKMTDSFRADRAVRGLEASAYAGRCGLRFLDMIDTLSNLGSTKLFLKLMQAYPGATSLNVADCYEAERIIQQIDTVAANRTTDENLLMVFANFAKIGTLTSAYADANANGSPDWSTGDACLVGSLPDAMADQVGTALANAMASMTAVGSSIPGAGQLTTMTTLCSDITSTLGASYNFCAALTTTSVTANMRRAIRSLIQENQYMGIGSCNDTLANCLCP